MTSLLAIFLLLSSQAPKEKKLGAAGRGPHVWFCYEDSLVSFRVLNTVSDKDGKNRQTVSELNESQFAAELAMRASRDLGELVRVTVVPVQLQSRGEKLRILPNDLILETGSPTRSVQAYGWTNNGTVAIVREGQSLETFFVFTGVDHRKVTGFSIDVDGILYRLQFNWEQQ